jgi:putative radical SAM enzyme (TIGR03279 family)
VAAGAGLAPGDWLLTVNGHRLRDIIDFRFYTADDDLTLEVRRGALVRTVCLMHGPEDPLGLELRGDGLELITECTNHCPFCFVTQLPKGMRRTLSIKDDDYRYSFLFANFVTLTNLAEEDWARIGQQHLSPLYVSVHSTDAQIRRKLLGNRFAQDPLEQIDRLGRLGITVHTQLVLCPGINDGEHLDRSIADLMARYPQVRTIAAVPVGLTRIRTERTMSRGMPLRKFRPEEARRVLEQVEAVQRHNKKLYGVPVVYVSDELYLVAGRTVPGAAHYDDGAQLENGVGLVRQLLNDWRRLKRRLPATLPRPRHLTMACATLIAPVLQRIVDEMNTIGNLRVDLHVVRNRLFGDEVTVSGLIVGRDLLAALAGHELGDTLVLPRVMFDHGGTLTLDDMTLDDLRAAADRPIATVKRCAELGEVLAA